jgi:hypothetical protein
VIPEKERSGVPAYSSAQGSERAVISGKIARRDNRYFMVVVDIDLYTMTMTA